jgi:hypothetical protein
MWTVCAVSSFGNIAARLAAAPLAGPAGLHGCGVRCGTKSPLTTEQRPFKFN